jgi:DNA-binding GntR family transcriptional regulator
VLINEVIIGSDEVCARLRVPGRQSVLQLRRVRLVGDEPLAILENYLPDDLGTASGGIAGGIAGADLTAVGLYQAMRDAGVRMCVAKQRIGAREGTREGCELLEVPTGSPVLTMDRVTHDDSGRVVEWARRAYRPDRYAFTVTLVGR